MTPPTQQRRSEAKVRFRSDDMGRTSPSACRSFVTSATPLSMATLDDDFAFAKEAAVAAGRDPDALTLTIEGAGILAPDSLEQTAESLSKLKERGVFHAILGVHPRHIANANQLIEDFAAKHLPALQA